jgi:hypothetical protein
MDWLPELFVILWINLRSMTVSKKERKLRKL